MACALSLSQLHSHCCCYLTLPGRRAPSLSHTQQLQAFAVCVCLRVCSCEYVCVCACVYLASLVSPSFRVSLLKGNARTTKTAPALSSPMFSILVCSHFYCSLVLCCCWPLSPLVSCIHFLGIRIVLCAVSHSFLVIHSRLHFSFSSLLISSLATFLIIVFSQSYPFY